MYCSPSCALDVNRRRVAIPEYAASGVVFRQCRTCKKFKARDASFHRQKAHCGGFRTACKECRAIETKRSAGRNSARTREWYVANKQHVIERVRRRRAKCEAYPPILAHQFVERLSVFGSKCAYCGADHEEWDHVIPIARGGPHCLANLRPSCRACNRSKAARPLSEWLASRKEAA